MTETTYNEKKLAKDALWAAGAGVAGGYLGAGALSPFALKGMRRSPVDHRQALGELATMAGRLGIRGEVGTINLDDEFYRPLARLGPAMYPGSMAKNLRREAANLGRRIAGGDADPIIGLYGRAGSNTSRFVAAHELGHLAATKGKLGLVARALHSTPVSYVARTLGIPGAAVAGAALGLAEPGEEGAQFRRAAGVAALAPAALLGAEAAADWGAVRALAGSGGTTPVKTFGREWRRALRDYVPRRAPSAATYLAGTTIPMAVAFGLGRRARNRRNAASDVQQPEPEKG